MVVGAENEAAAVARILIQPPDADVDERRRAVTHQHVVEEHFDGRRVKCVAAQRLVRNAGEAGLEYSLQERLARAAICIEIASEQNGLIGAPLFRESCTQPCRLSAAP